MSRPKTEETPPRRRKLAAVPDLDAAPAKAPKKVAPPRPARSTPTPPASPPQTGARSQSSAPTLLQRYERYLAATPPTKRRLANAELEKALAGLDARLAFRALDGPVFSFHAAAVVEAVSQAYNATGDGKPVLLAERFDRILATPMKPTSRRAHAAYFAHVDEAAVREILAGASGATANPEDRVRVLAALHQAFSAHYAFGKPE